MKTNKTIVAFHIGRGGRYHNEGYLSYLGTEDISHYVGDLFINYEHAEKFKNRLGYDRCYDDQRCILDLLTDNDLDELEEKFDITEDQLGDRQYYTCGGSPVGLTQDECDSGIGKINIDNGYDTTYTVYLEDINEDEATAIISASGYVSYNVLQVAREVVDAD